MGMFNYVEYSCLCPKCGTIVDEWQTKDGCRDLVMDLVQPSEVTYFYGTCPKCKKWIDAKVVPTQYHIVVTTEEDVEEEPK